MTSTTSFSDIGGTSLWSVDSSSMYSWGRRSGRVDRIWPSFPNVGPSSSNACRSRRARSRRSSPGPIGLSSSRRPCLLITRPMRVARPRRCPSTGGSSRVMTGTGLGTFGSEVSTMNTEHGALWETRLGTLPSRNFFRPTTIASVPSWRATSTIAAAGSWSTTTRPRPRDPTNSAAKSPSSAVACVTRAPSSAAVAPSAAGAGSSTWSTSSCAS